MCSSSASRQAPVEVCMQVSSSTMSMHEPSCFNTVSWSFSCTPEQAEACTQGRAVLPSSTFKGAWRKIDSVGIRRCSRSE